MRIVVTRRGVQIALGLIWLLDGVLQFQTYFYTKPFLTQFIDSMAAGQPHLIAHSITWASHFAAPHLTQYDTLFGLIQVVIGLGLLYPPTVRPALALSFVWVPIVWWFGEGFGMIPADTASPLTGAPGAVLLYGLIGLLVWPRGRPDRSSAADGGLIGERGGLIAWSLLWILAAALWLVAINRSSGAFQSTISAQQPMSMHWLASLQGSVATATGGHGLLLAIVLSAASAAVAVGVWTPLALRRPLGRNRDLARLLALRAGHGRADDDPGDGRQRRAALHPARTRTDAATHSSGEPGPSYVRAGSRVSGGRHSADRGLGNVNP